MDIQGLLCELAENPDCYLKLRLAAINKLTNQKILENIAKKSYHAPMSKTNDIQEAREAAVKKITNQKVLSELALNTVEYGLSIVATEKLSNQETLAYIAKIGPAVRTDVKCRKATIAVKKLKDRKLLEDVARNASCDYVRNIANIMLNKKTYHKRKFGSFSELGIKD